MDIRKQIYNNKKSIDLFKKVNSLDYINYKDLTIDMRYIFRRYFNIKAQDIANKEVLISNKGKNEVQYAELNGYILYDLDKVAINNIILEMKQENRKYRNIVNKKQGDDF